MASTSSQLGGLFGSHAVAAATAYLSYRASANSNPNDFIYDPPPPPPPQESASEVVATFIPDFVQLEGRPMHFTTPETTWVTPCLFLAAFLVASILCFLIRGDYHAIDLEDDEAEEFVEDPETPRMAAYQVALITEKVSHNLTRKDLASAAVSNTELKRAKEQGDAEAENVQKTLKYTRAKLVKAKKVLISTTAMKTKLQKANKDNISYANQQQRTLEGTREELADVKTKLAQEKVSVNTWVESYMALAEERDNSEDEVQKLKEQKQQIFFQRNYCWNLANHRLAGLNQGYSILNDLVDSPSGETQIEPDVKERISVWLYEWFSVSQDSTNCGDNGNTGDDNPVVKKALEDDDGAGPSGKSDDVSMDGADCASAKEKPVNGDDKQPPSKSDGINGGDDGKNDLDSTSIKKDLQANHDGEQRPTKDDDAANDDDVSATTKEEPQMSSAITELGERQPGPHSVTPTTGGPAAPIIRVRNRAPPSIFIPKKKPIKRTAVTPAAKISQISVGPPRASYQQPADGTTHGISQPAAPYTAGRFTSLC